MDEQKLEKLKRLLEVADTDFVSSQDFVNIIEIIIDGLSAFREDIQKKQETADSDLTTKIDNFIELCNRNLKEVTSTANSKVADFNKELNTTLLTFKKDFQQQIDDIELTPGEDGEDAEITEEIKDEIVLRVMGSLKDKWTPELARQVKEAVAEAVKDIKPQTTFINQGDSGFGAPFEIPIKAGLNVTVTKDASGAYVISSTGSGGGNVDSVNGQTGVVVLTTANIADSTNARYVTDAELTVIQNTSGVNTGDNATNTQYSGLAASKLDANFLSIGSLTDPGANVLMAWDDTDNALKFITIGSNLSYDHATHTLSATGGGGGASTALDNLASVAINTSLISDTDVTDDLGSALKKWNNLFVATIGATGTRVTKIWATDMTITNAISGSITGNAGTVTNATLTTALTVNGGTLTLTANVANTSVLTIGAGAVSVSGANTGDNATNSQYSGLAASKADVGQTFYIGTTQVAINRASAALTLAGITLTTPDIGTPSAGVGTNFSGTGANFTAGHVTNATFTTALTINGGTLTLTANVANTSVLTIGAGAVSVSGSNTGDQDLSGYLLKSTYDANTILYATTDNTPVALTVAASTFVGRKASGDISAMSVTEATALLNVFGADAGAGGVKGLVPATVNGDNVKYLKGDGTWATVTAGVPTTITVANEATDTTCFVAFFTTATGDLAPKTNANLAFNSNTGILTLVTPVFTGLPTGTGVASAATASTLAARDANANITANNWLGGYRTTATAAGTTTLVVGDAFLQYFTGSTTQTVVLPVTSTLTLGHQFTIVNNSTGLITVQSSGANPIVVMTAGTTAVLTCILTSGTDGASWALNYEGGGSGNAIYGNGADGTVTFTTGGTVLGMVSVANVYTMVQDIYCINMTVNNGVSIITSGFRIFCSGTLTNNGTIQWAGKDAVTNTGGASLVIGNIMGGLLGGGAPASGTSTVAGTAPASYNSLHITLGGKGGVGGGANGGAAGGTSTNVKTRFRALPEAIQLVVYPTNDTLLSTEGTTQNSYAGGGTGGGGGGRTTGGTATVGGAGGGGAGLVLIVAKSIDNTNGTISAKGGNGAAASGAGTCVTGGGGGGGGGAIILIYNTLINIGTTTVAGGTKGAGLNGASAAADGSAGNLIQISNA